MLNLPITKLSQQAQYEKNWRNCLPSGFRTEILYNVRRHIWIVLATVSITLTMAILYILLTPQLYTAHAQLLLDPRNPKPVVEHETTITSFDTPEVESQITILESEPLHAAVVDALKLYADPEFVPRLESEPAQQKEQGAAPNPADVSEAIHSLKDGLEIKRIKLSYILDISFSSQDPGKAALVANAIVETYINEQLSYYSRIASQGTVWLEGRIDQLRQHVNEAVLKLQEFRAKRRSKEDNQTTIDTLESTASTYRKLYEGYLQAYTESMQRQALPPAMARIVTRATVPMTPSHPRKSIILAVSFLLGLLAGYGIATLRHLLDQSVRSGRQIEQAGIFYLGEVRDLTRLADHETGGKSVFQRLRRMWKYPKCMQMIANEPMSQFSFDMRRLERQLARMTIAVPVRCIGVAPTSLGPRAAEVSCNLAYLYATKGNRVLLVDANVYSTSLTREFAKNAEKGLADVLLGSAEARDCIISNAIGHIDLLPAGVAEGPMFTTWPFAPKLLRERLEQIQEKYDMIIFDLPAACSPAALSISCLLEAVVIVAEYGRTQITYLEELSAAYGSTAGELVGAAVATTA